MMLLYSALGDLYLNISYFQLVIALLFMLISTYYYIYAVTSLRVRRRRPVHRGWRRPPFITVMLPVYNERHVIERLIRACLNFNYPNFEVVILDDSTDPQTIALINRWRGHPRVKIVRRRGRDGYKAGALNNGLRYIDPRSEFIAVFDADNVPPRNALWMLLDGFIDPGVGAVQGCVAHRLNAESIGTAMATDALLLVHYRSIMPARDSVDGLVTIMGSAFMIKRRVLEEIGGFPQDSITEDWNLTLRIYMAGYKVRYLDDLIVEAEGPVTIWDFLRQQMRWAEGTTRDTRKNILRVLRSRRMTLRQKLDFLGQGFYGIYMIMAAVSFVAGLIQTLIGGLIWLVTGLQVNPPLWIQIAMSVLGIYNLMPFTMHMLIGLRREGKSLKWALHGSVLVMLMMPFVAYSAIRGLVAEKGVWIVTPKYGGILVRKLKVKFEVRRKGKSTEPIPAYMQPMIVQKFSRF